MIDDETMGEFSLSYFENAIQSVNKCKHLAFSTKIYILNRRFKAHLS